MGSEMRNNDFAGLHAGTYKLLSVSLQEPLQRRFVEELEVRRRLAVFEQEEVRKR